MGTDLTDELAELMADVRVWLEAQSLAGVSELPVEQATAAPLPQAPLLVVLSRPVNGPGKSMLDNMLSRVVGIAPDAAWIGVGMPERVADRGARLVLVMGDSACQAAFGRSVGAARGQELRVDGVPAVATFDTNHLVQQPGDKRPAFEDLKRAKSFLA